LEIKNMKFESKSDMAQALVSGKQFSDGVSILYFDHTQFHPFRYGTESMPDSVWSSWSEDIWTEVTPTTIKMFAEKVTPRHIHQDLIDSYEEGQAWQIMGLGGWVNYERDGLWATPEWQIDQQYRIHKHNELIQAHKKGIEIERLMGDGTWISTPDPMWYNDYEYRIKPTIKKKTVYEWIHSTSMGDSYGYYTIFLSDDAVDSYFGCREECVFREKTGRSLEVGV
jgi:hypothetical protein